MGCRGMIEARNRDLAGKVSVKKFCVLMDEDKSGTLEAVQSSITRLLAPVPRYLTLLILTHFHHHSYIVSSVSDIY